MNISKQWNEESLALSKKNCREQALSFEGLAETPVPGSNKNKIPDYFFQRCSICSSDLPLVSGTIFHMKTAEIIPMTP